MSLLEWSLEPANRGPIGKVEINPPEPNDGEPPRKWLVWVAVVIGLLCLGIGLYGVFYDLPAEGAKLVLFKLGSLALYVVISHFVTVTPNYTNVGWVRGLLDNPFRISDDYNRRLIVMQAILLPGKLIAYSLLMSWLLGQYLFKRRKK